MEKNGSYGVNESGELALCDPVNYLGLKSEMHVPMVLVGEGILSEDDRGNTSVTISTGNVRLTQLNKLHPVVVVSKFSHHYPVVNRITL